MLVTLSPVFEADAQIIFGYSFVAPLSIPNFMERVWLLFFNS